MLAVAKVCQRSESENRGTSFLSDVRIGPF